jgi:hypothetical protein
MNKNAPEIIQLRLDVEQRAGFRPSSPADFETLILKIWEVLHENIALSTLERLWGYVDGAENTRQSTLDLLARFVGHRDWRDYLEQLTRKEQGSSHSFIGEGVHTQDLQPNQRIEVTWLPNRRCVFRYLGDMRFVVEESIHSKLQVGNTFISTFFLIGQPLYIDQLIQNTHPPVSYIAGNNGGLQSVTLK